MAKKINIYIGVTQGISLYSKLIKFFQWGNLYTHTFYLEESEYEKADPIVIESTAGYGVHRAKLSVAHTLGTKYTIFSLKVTLKEKEEVEKFLYSKMGSKYDYLGLLGFVARRSTEDSNKYFCSEFLYTALLYAKVKLFRTLTPTQVYPALFIESVLLKEEYSSESI